MKKLFAGLISLAAALLAVCAITVCAGAEWSGDYEYSVLDDGTVEITDYTGSATNLTIPATIGGKKVTSIGDDAFYGSSLKSIIIPDGVTRIGDWAFYNCSSLTSIDIPDSVTSIGEYTFDGCSSLTSIDIPNSVTSIEGGAFENCSSLTSINIPDGVTSIGDGTFWGCSSLTSIDIPDSVTSIGGGAFENCSSLTSVDIPDSVTSIGEDAFSDTPFLKNQTGTVKYAGKWVIDCDRDATNVTIKSGTVGIADSAFYFCSSLTSINIPDSVTNIGDEAFERCSSLTSITVDNNNKNYSSQDGVLFNKDITELIVCPTGKKGEYNIPDSVTSIGERAFYNCSSLTSITIPDGVTSIGDDAFYYCSSLTSIKIPDSVTSIEGYTFGNCSSLTSIDIPDSVTSIGEYAFSGCSSLISVTIPDGVTSIGNSAFSGCSSLISVTIPDGVTSIGNYTFSDCSSLTSITIPNGVTDIMGCAFLNCSSLVSINLPKSVVHMGYIVANMPWTCTFSGCTSLTSINVDNNNKVYSSQDGVLFNKNKTEIMLCPAGKKGKYTIPDGVKSIGDDAFGGCSGLTSIDIPDGVRSIEFMAFSGCSSLTSVDIPDGVTSIGSMAFYGCTSLKSIKIPESVTEIGDYGEACAFFGCTSLTSIKIPSKVTKIYPGTFSECSSLTAITIPDGVTLIDIAAFENCTNLTSVDIPDSVTSIGRDAFSGTPFLDNQTTTVKYAGKWAVDCDEDAVTAELKSGTIGIADYAFRNCTSLTSIKIPDSVTSIGSYAFSDTPFLKNQTGTVKYAGKCVIDCDESTTTVEIKSDTVGIAGRAFQYCRDLTSVTIPDGVTSIGDEAFENCESLKSIKIPDGVTSIGDSAFYNCSSLTSINIPDSVTSIGGNAFSRCTNLTSITIPDSVTSIEHNAFSGCTSLTSVNIGDGATSISYNAFWGCSSLTSITVDDNNEYYSSKDGVLFNKGKTQIILCPEGKKGKYTIPDGVTSIGDWAFDDCSSLTSITIPESVTSIGSSAFSRCSSLTSIAIPESVTSIGSSAFYDCVKLKDVYYTGSKAQWDKIAIGESNDHLLGANIHCLDLGISGLKLKARAADALRISWNKNTSADGYIIEMKDGTKWTRVAKITKNSTVEYRKDKLKAGTAYSFRICAYKMDGSTALYSGYTSISARTNPSAVSGLKLKARAADALRISWTKNTSADGYIIEMKNGSTWTRVAKITKNTTVEFRKDKLKAGTAYTFRVKAYKMDGKTALYSGYTTITARTNPSAVSGLKLKARAADALRLAWTKNASADGYIIEMKSGNSWTRVGKITSNSTIEFKKSKLKAGTAYTFRVKAYKMSGKTALYGATKTISVRTNPSATTGLKLKNSAKNAVRLSWTKNTSADGYIIEMKSGNSWVRVGKITKNSTVEFKKSGLKSKTSYTFRIKAYKMSGKTALYGATKTITVKTK